MGVDRDASSGEGVTHLLVRTDPSQDLFGRLHEGWVVLRRRRARVGCLVKTREALVSGGIIDVRLVEISLTF